MLAALLTVLAMCSGTLHIRAEYCGPRNQVYLFKPLTTILILLIAVQASTPEPALYKYAIIAGLVFSLAGDIFLMLPSDQFIAGLVSFLVGHLFYIRAFTLGTGFGFNWWLLPPFVVFGVVIFRILSPHLGKMKVPVIAYMAVILVMAWQAWERLAQTGQIGSVLASVGAVFFVVSDSALALDRFRGRFESARAVALSTYYAAQWLIALSVTGVL
jgi:uncharacterized membrane protein YhhN